MVVCGGIGVGSRWVCGWMGHWCVCVSVGCLWVGWLVGDGWVGGGCELVSGVWWLGAWMGM